MSESVDTDTNSGGEPAKPRVLIVDDSRIVRATIIKHVKGRYDFREEADGEAGWAALLVDRGIQVVISDLGMPKLDGYGLLERLRASSVARIRDIPFVIISGDEDEASRARAKELGATDFITKGIGTAELLARLDSLVKLTQTQGQLEETRENLLDNPVTGLKTRKFVEVQAAQALSHAQRHGLSTSLLVMGLDRLDDMRNQYGAAAINALVQRFGQMLASKMRREDSLGHVSETTFAAVTPSTDEAGAQVFAGRLREFIEQANVGFQGQRLPLTVSIGIACCPPDAVCSPAEFIEVAVTRMIDAAAAGGNRFVIHGGDASIGPQPPKLEAAMAILKSGKEEGLRRCIGMLGLNMMPLLRFIDQECRLGLPLQNIEETLGKRAQAEKDAQS